MRPYTYEVFGAITGEGGAGSVLCGTTATLKRSAALGRNMFCWLVLAFTVAGCNDGLLAPETTSLSTSAVSAGGSPFHPAGSHHTLTAVGDSVHIDTPREPTPDTPGTSGFWGHPNNPSQPCPWSQGHPNFNRCIWNPGTPGTPGDPSFVRLTNLSASILRLNADGWAVAVAQGTGRIQRERETGTDTISVLVDLPPPPPGAGEIVVAGFTRQAVQQALTQAANQGGGVLRFPAGTYDLRDWPTGGVQVNVPVTLIGTGNAVLQGAGNAHLFDFGKQVHIEGLEFRNWMRPIRFARAADWANNGVASAFVHVVNSRFLDVAIAIEGRKESGTNPPVNAHRLTLLQVSGSTFERTRRAVDFRRVFIDRFEFTHNRVRDVIHRNPEPDVPQTITTVLQIGADLEDSAQRATEVVIQHNDIRRVRNEDMVNGRAYAILAYRGPTIVEHNHIEDVVASDDSEDGAAAIYQRSRTYARFAHNRVVNGTNTPNVAAVFHKQGGAPFEVLNNEIIFTDEFKDLHNSPEYGAFEGTLADLRFEGNRVVGATRMFVTRMDTNNYGRPKSEQIVRNNTFENCEPRPNTSTMRGFTLGYRRSLVEVSGNQFVNCSRGGNEFIFITGTDNFDQTDELRITDNQWIHTTPGLRVPSQVIRFNAFPRNSVITNNRYEYLPSDPAASPTPITLVMLPGSLAGETGARMTVSDNQLQGLRTGTTAAITILDSRAGIAELRVERNRVMSGGNFVRLSNRAPQLTVVRDNDARGITGVVVRRDVQGGELIMSGNTQ